ncbi:hypothetical protein NJ7G_1880 [Natrinema sp. J7-2]|nr:hypothetical protein NJ7G_1880 [Natrinema sp. J7-2]
MDFQSTINNITLLVQLSQRRPGRYPTERTVDPTAIAGRSVRPAAAGR